MSETENVLSIDIIFTHSIQTWALHLATLLNKRYGTKYNVDIRAVEQFYFLIAWG